MENTIIAGLLGIFASYIGGTSYQYHEGFWGSPPRSFVDSVNAFNNSTKRLAFALAGLAIVISSGKLDLDDVIILSAIVLAGFTLYQLHIARCYIDGELERASEASTKIHPDDVEFRNTNDEAIKKFKREYNAPRILKILYFSKELPLISINTRDYEHHKT